MAKKIEKKMKSLAKDHHFTKLPAVVQALKSGFDSGKWSSHLEPIPLPSRTAMVELVLQAQKILFPGYFSGMALEADTLAYYLGHELVTFRENLARQIKAASRHDCQRHSLGCLRGDDQAYQLAEALIDRLPEIKGLLESDIEATMVGDPAAANADEVVFSYPGLFATFVYRLAHELFCLEVPVIPRIMSEYAYSRTAIDIHPGARIGHTFFIDHGAGVVVGATSEIGNGVRLYQGVTLGAVSLPRDAGNSLRDTKRHPTIEDDVIIYANATILGGATVIGARSIIGGNVWLTESVGSDTKVLLKQPELVYLGKKER